MKSVASAGTTCLGSAARCQVAPRFGFPFPRGQAPCWRTVLDIIFRCDQETRRRGLGRDASGPGALPRPFPQVAWLDRSCCVPTRAASVVLPPCIARHAPTSPRRAPTPPAADRSARHARRLCKRRAPFHFARPGNYTLRRDGYAFRIGERDLQAGRVAAEFLKTGIADGDGSTRTVKLEPHTIVFMKVRPRLASSKQRIF